MKHNYILPLLALIFSSGVSFGQSPIAEGKDKFLGNIYSSAQLPDFTDYWNQVTPENAGKWGSVERTRDVMDWSALDAAYELARENGFPFRFHVLIWGNQQPAWIADLSPAEQREEIEEWFAAVAERYPDLELIEVVNEPLNDPPSKNDNGGGNYIEALGGTGTTGWDWIITSFELAREYFPDAELMINEYNIVHERRNTQRYVQIAELLQERDLIDAIGAQAHAFSTKYGTSEEITSNLDLLAATGLPIIITEMDIDGETDEQQLEEYKRVFPLFWNHQAVRGVTLWGFRPGMWRTEQSAFLIDRSGNERPALVWLREYVEGMPNGGITGVGPEFSQTFSVYPNPVTNGHFRLKGDLKFRKVKVIDFSGKELKEINIAKHSSTVIELNVAPGVYVLQLIDDQRVMSQKIIVQ